MRETEEMIEDNLTKSIFELDAPYDNPYQGKDKRVLFVCSAGILRSATAAAHYASLGFNTRCAGSAPYALIPLSVNLLAWAQQVVFVNRENYLEALETFKKADNHATNALYGAIVLDIPDKYPYKHPELVRLLKEQLDGKL